MLVLIVWQPRIQRLVRKRFGQAPQNERQKDELVSTLYSSLMEQVCTHSIQNEGYTYGFRRVLGGVAESV